MSITERLILFHFLFSSPLYSTYAHDFLFKYKQCCGLFFNIFLSCISIEQYFYWHIFVLKDCSFMFQSIDEPIQGIFHFTLVPLNLKIILVFLLIIWVYKLFCHLLLYVVPCIYYSIWCINCAHVNLTVILHSICEAVYFKFLFHLLVVFLLYILILSCINTLCTN